MGVSKSEVFTETQNHIANLSKAIGHPARVAIIEYLLEQETCICKNIVDELPLAQPTISQHLKELKNVGLIKGKLEGNTVCYCLDKKGINQLLIFFTKALERINTSGQECC